MSIIIPICLYLIFFRPALVGLLLSLYVYAVFFLYHYPYMSKIWFIFRTALYVYYHAYISISHIHIYFRPSMSVYCYPYVVQRCFLSLCLYSYRPTLSVYHYIDIYIYMSI